MKKISGKLDEKLYSRNFTKLGMDLNPVVSLVSALFIFMFSLYALIDVDRASQMFESINTFITSRFDWFFILTSSFLILVCFILAISKYGKIRIGGFDSKPEFSNFSWYSMLLSAGMGIGLMFWSVGEPLEHFNNIPPIFESSNDPVSALATTFFHWGIHPWAIYALLGLSLAYFAYNRKLPLSLRSVFYPLFKEKIFGTLGDIIDIFATLACLFGLATSLGLGAQQINSGLNYTFNIPVDVVIQVILIGLITAIASVSVISGLDKGVRVLSEWNLRIAFTLIVFLFLIGPTGYIIQLFSNSLGLYINDFVGSSLFVGESTWQGDWTIFYLAWWISWSPFVGSFIARISKGRTIREFISAVLIIPAILSFIWIAVFGGTAIFLDSSANGALYEVVTNQLPVALFEMISLLDIPFLQNIIQLVLSIIGTLLIMIFFITSSDSGSLVVNNMTSGGKENTPTRQRVFWAVMEGLLAATLLLIGGEQALNALQTAVIATGLPFALILIIMTVVLFKSLKDTYEKQSTIASTNQYKKVRRELDKKE